MKTNNIQELLDVEIYQKNDFYYLEVPVQNIIQPKFLLKDNTLYLFLYDYKDCYIIKNLNPSIIDAIKNEKCFFLESINPLKIKHLIILYP